MGYVHKVVVNNVCKIIGRETVGLNKYLVVKLLVVYGNCAVYCVVKDGSAAVGHFLADNKGYAVFKVLVYFLL